MFSNTATMTKMKRMRLGRHLAWGWPAVSTMALLLLVQCDDFTEAPGSGADGGGDSASGTIDSSSQTSDSSSFDAALPDGSGIDAGSKMLTCGNAKCNLSKNEFCCMYFKDGVGVRSGECILDKECTVPDSGVDHLVLVSECDDSSDCSTGQVCCHSQLPDNNGKCGALPTVARCTAPDNCKPCWEDGGLGKIACDPGKSGECGAASCKPENPLSVIIASGYCAQN